MRIHTLLLSVFSLLLSNFVYSQESNPVVDVPENFATAWSYQATLRYVPEQTTTFWQINLGFNSWGNITAVAVNNKRIAGSWTPVQFQAVINASGERVVVTPVGTSNTFNAGEEIAIDLEFNFNSPSVDNEVLIITTGDGGNETTTESQHWQVDKENNLRPSLELSGNVSVSRLGVGVDASNAQGALHVWSDQPAGEPMATIEGSGAYTEPSVGLRLYDLGSEPGNENMIEFSHAKNNVGPVPAVHLSSKNVSQNMVNGADFTIETALDDQGNFNKNQVLLKNDGRIGLGLSSGRLSDDLLTIGRNGAAVFHDGGSKALSWNAHYSGGEWKFIDNGFASQLYVQNGDQRFQLNVAEAGSSGNVISWNHAITVNRFGGVGLGNEPLGEEKLFVDGVAVVKGQTNNYGRDVLKLYSPNHTEDGRHQYLYFSHRDWSGELTGGNAHYAAIGAYGASYDQNGTETAGGPRHLLIQEQTAGGNLGIGPHTEAPDAKLSIIGLTKVRASVSEGDDALKLYHARPDDVTGMEHYMFLGNREFQNGGQMYSTIGAYESLSTSVSQADGTEGPKHLVLQAQWESTPNTVANLGVGYHTEAPAAKLSVNGTGFFTGSVSIGTKVDSRFYPYSNSRYMLAVEGGIVAKEVSVLYRNQWPDYVFEEGYKLRSLEEVDEFVEENGHLPDVPTAKEVEEEGIEVGEMLKVQMEKIEELTLYLIEQNEKLEEQNKRLAEQALKIKELQEKLDEDEH